MRSRRHTLVLLFLSFASCSPDNVRPEIISTDPGTPMIPPESLLVWRDSEVVSDARPVFDDHSVYSLANHMAYAVDKVTGKRLWSTALIYPAGPSPLGGSGTAVAAGRVIIGDTDIFGLDPTSGAILWRFSPRLLLPKEREFELLITDGVTVYVGGVWGNVYALDAATGTPKWTTHVTTLPDSDVWVASPEVAAGVVYAPFRDMRPKSPDDAIDGGLAAIDAASGRLLWWTFLPRHVGLKTGDTRSVAVTSTRVFVGGGDGFFYGLDPKTGTILDSLPQTTFGVDAGTSMLGWFTLTVSDTVLVVGSTTGAMVGLDARNMQRKLWTANYTAAGTITDIFADATRVYVTYLNGFFAVFDLGTGKLALSLSSYGLRWGEWTNFAPAVDGNRIYLGTNLGVYAFKRY